MSIPWVESPFFERELEQRRGALTPEEQTLAVQFHENGYLILEDVVAHELCDRVLAEIGPIYEEPEVIKARRIQDAWSRGGTAVRELATFAPFQELLTTLYGRRSIPFQTLNFKWGSEQRGHSDSIHFSCIPARYMCGIWVALEDTDEANGPLFYHPGSHKLPEITVYDLGQTVKAPHYGLYEDFQHELMKEIGIEPIEFHARKGTALIWSSNIVHGGMAVTAEGRTRWSQVTHYYFENCAYYTPFYSDIATGEFLLKDVVDLNTLEPVDHSYDGQPLAISRLPNGRSRLSTDASQLPVGSPAEVPEDGWEDLRAQIERLEEELSVTRSELSRLRQSPSFRLGYALLEPGRLYRELRQLRGGR
jgi:hypothetical protein